MTQEIYSPVHPIWEKKKFKCLGCNKEFNSIEEVINHFENGDIFHPRNSYKLIGTKYNLMVE